MSKRIIGLLLAISLVIGAIPFVAFSSSAAEDWTLYGPTDATMNWENDQLQLNSSTINSTTKCINTGGELYGDFVAEFTYHFDAGVNNDAAIFNYRMSSDGAKGYSIYFVHCPDNAKQYYIKFCSWPYTEMIAGFFFNDGGKGVAYDSDVQVKVVAIGTTHQLYMTVPGGEYGDPIYTYTEPTALYTEGHMGFSQWHANVEGVATTSYGNLVVNTPIVAEGENMTFVSGGVVHTQNMSNKFSNSMQMLFANKTEGGEATLSFVLEEDWKGLLSFSHCMAGDFGIFDIYLNDTLIFDNLDMYNASLRASNALHLEELELSAGTHYLKLVNVGKNESSTNYLGSIDCLKMMRAPEKEEIGVEGWDLYGAADGTIKQVDDQIRISSSTMNATTKAIHTGGEQYGDFVAEFTYHFEAGAHNDAAIFNYRISSDGTKGYSIYFVRCSDNENQYYIKLVSWPYKDMIAGFFFNNGGKGIPYNSDVQVKVVAVGTTHQLYMTVPGGEYGDPIYTYTEETALYSKGYVGFSQWHANIEGATTTSYGNLSVSEYVEEPAEDWSLYGSTDATLKVENGQVQLNNATLNSTTKAIYTGGEQHDDFIAEFTYHFEAGAHNDAAIFNYRISSDGAKGYSIYFVRCPDNENQYYIKLASWPYKDMIAGFFFNNGGKGIPYNSDVQVKVVANGTTHQLYMTVPGGEYGDPIYTYTEETALYSKGYVGFSQWHANIEGATTTSFANLTVSEYVEEETPVPVEGWDYYGADDGTMYLVDEQIQLSSAKLNSYAKGIYTDGGQYGDFVAEFTYHIDQGAHNDAPVFLYRANSDGSAGYALYFVRCADADNQYWIKLCSWPYKDMIAGFFFNNNGAGIAYDSDVQVKVVANGTTHQLYMTVPGGEYGDPIYTYTEETALYTEGYVGFAQYHANIEGTTTTSFGNLMITEIEDNPVVFEGQQLVLGDDLTMKFALSIEDKIASKATIKLTVDGDVASCTVSEMTADANGFYWVSVDVAAAQMTEDIHVAVVTESETINENTYTVLNYANVILNGNYSDETKALVKEMLNYGAKAQTYFAYNTDMLANAGYEDEVTPATMPTAADAVTVDGSVSGITYYGSSMIFTGKLGVRYYFNISGNSADYTFTANGKTYTAKEKDGLYYIEVNDINPQDIDESVLLVVSDGNNTLSVGYGPMNYIVRMYEKGSENLKNLLQALYGYHLAAEEYIESITAIEGIPTPEESLE